MTIAVTTQQAPKVPAQAKWTPPVVECCETRPEVTSYAGDTGPWNNR